MRSEVTALTVRELASDDLDAVAGIEQASNPNPWSRSLFEGELKMSPSERHWIVGLVDDAVVGFAGAMFVGEDVHVMNVAVDPAVRGRGYGRALLAELLMRCVAQGGRQATLEVRRGNMAAIALYRHFRLGPVGIRSRYYPDGEDALILWAHDIDSADYAAVLLRLGGRSGEAGD